MDLWVIALYNDQGVQFQRLEVTGEPRLDPDKRCVVGGRLPENQLPAEVLLGAGHTAILYKLRTALQPH